MTERTEPDPEPFEVRVGDDEIADLRARLARTRWPEAETVDDWSQGLPLAYARELCGYWADGYDFDLADRVNAFPQFRVTIDGLGVHLVHVRSPEPDALPLVLTHGWPGSVVEFLDVIGPLTDPRRHGGDPADAFHVVAPSLPGYGWSDKPALAGWKVDRIAGAWDDLMVRLGYERYGAQGGDWGAIISRWHAFNHPDRAIGLHLNMLIGGRPPEGEGCFGSPAGSHSRITLHPPVRPAELAAGLLGRHAAGGAGRLRRRDPQRGGDGTGSGGA